MGIKERRSKEKESVKASILVEAKRIARQEGWQQVTIRKIADAIEYSIPTIYEHFENKDDLLNELRVQGYQILCELLEERVALVGSPHNVLIAIALVYWDFAWEYTELFELMHRRDLTNSNGGDRVISYSQKIRSIGQQAIMALADGKVPVVIMDDKLDSARCIVQGFIDIALGGSMQKERVKRLMLNTLEEYIVAGLD